MIDIYLQIISGLGREQNHMTLELYAWFMSQDNRVQLIQEMQEAKSLDAIIKDGSRYFDAVPFYRNTYQWAFFWMSGIDLDGLHPSCGLCDFAFDAFLKLVEENETSASLLCFP